MTGGWIAVVAGALVRADGRWLMHRRPVGKHHAGLWEFPGGKVEGNEMPLQSLIRELTEELGILCDPQACTPAGFATSAAAEGQRGLVILLYTITGWDGEPQALEGGAIGWFTPAESLALDKPPLDVALAARLFANIPNSAQAPLPRPNDPPKGPAPVRTRSSAG
ncbi:(deoxy)nucleoside triphosphate pyrophosphohydrolase [Porphyrobacter sp. YT40]|uniref:(deoxy)nucleoside triphosphate pyrophosphohydrolase n=1 Tax=Porphyrobacter sp. YT40 TaxID=2547601 RepID=UPI001142B46C|nr:(deoxy)nucleoside triphosphate pyrophosphohydrolase [Porphyrobacter sp. YT40]QDH35173.1 (deoxy)nucleoside triphosphate pyrophosphohydrolase [Porphyrobacter sp. YT40]